MNNYNKIVFWMRENIQDYIIESGEPDCVSLAKDACSAFNLYEDNSIPEYLFDMAYNVAVKGRFEDGNDTGCCKRKD